MYLSIYPDQEYQDSGVTCARAFLARFRSSIPRVEGDERPPTHRPFSSTSSPLFLFEPSHRFTCDYRWTATGLWPRYDGNAHFAICCPSCAIRGSPRSDGCALLLVWKNMQSYFFKFMQVFRICTRFAKNRKVNVRSFLNLYPVWFLVEDLFLMDPIFVWIITLSYFITSLRIYLYQIIMNRNRLCMDVLWIFSVVFNFFYSLVHVLCQPNVRDACSIFAKQVYMGIQDRRVHGFAVFPQDCLDWKSKTLVICESVCSFTVDHSYLYFKAHKIDKRSHEQIQ